MSAQKLMAVWPVVDDSFSFEDLVEQGLGELERIAALAGARVVGPSTWRLVEAEGLPGWEHHDGQLLIATAPAEPVSPPGLLAERYGPLDGIEAERIAA